MLAIQRLEQYTIKNPQEVLLVSAQINGNEDEIAIFKGFSSSLMRPTEFDADVPILPEEATIERIDRVANPYNPNAPQYIEQGISWDEMNERLINMGV